MYVTTKMPLGVNIDDVWGERNLVSKPPPLKKSKYTQPSQQQMGNGQRNDMHAIQKEYMHGGGPGSISQGATMIPAQPMKMRQAPSQTSFPTPQRVPPSAGLPVSASQQPQTNPNVQEIPFLREKLTQQSSTVNDCQREVAYLKAMVQGLKQELYKQQMISQQKQQQAPAAKKNWTDCIYMILQVGLLLLVVILLIRLSHRMDLLMKTPLGMA